jgi:hypothetical protein
MIDFLGPLGAFLLAAGGDIGNASGVPQNVCFDNQSIMIL